MPRVSLNPSDLPKVDSGIRSRPVDPAALAALTALGLESEMEDYRLELLDRLVFSFVPHQKQPNSSYRRLLITPEAHGILKVVWKESSHITEEELATLGMAKIMNDGCITQHGLAVKLTDKPSEVSALNTQVRNVSIAAETFRLVERKQHSSTRVHLFGTILLHEFMTELGLHYMHLVNSLIPPNAGSGGQQ